MAGFGGDGGPAVKATFNTPQKLALAPDGAVYVTDRVNHRVRKIDRAGVITTVAGGEGAPAGVFVDPTVLPSAAQSQPAREH
jgi:serine/threonine-protein kinase